MHRSPCVASARVAATVVKVCTSETGVESRVTLVTTEILCLCVTATHAWRATEAARFPYATALYRAYRPSGEFSIQSPVISGLPHPTSSAPAFSQHFSGLLLQTDSPSCFIQAAPMGFKEHKRLGADLVFRSDASRGMCPSGRQGADVPMTAGHRRGVSIRPR
jgi:hypothetical protein